MKHFASILVLAVALCASSSAQTVKALSYNTNGQFITGTNELTFSNSVRFAQGDWVITESGLVAWSGSPRLEVETYTFYGPWSFDEPAAVRTNLGLILLALTNTSNVTMMRALSGSTNTNHPFSGTVSVVGTNNTNTLTFSNGILQSVQ